MKFFIKNDLSRILDVRWTIKDDGSLSGNRGTKPNSFEKYNADDFTLIDVSEEKAIYGINEDLFKIVDGKAKLKTITELKSQELLVNKNDAKNKCEDLYKSLRRSFSILNDEIYEFDIEALLLFDSQVKNKDSDIKVKEKGKKINAMTKTKAGLLAGKVNAYLESLSDAYNLDWDLIELEDYTMPNLTAIKEAQEAF